MRLDKFLSECKVLSRKECVKAAKGGRIAVNGIIAKKSDMQVNEALDQITLDGNKIEYRKYVYVMLNKPEGYVSATEDKNAPYVTELLSDDLRKYDLFPVGRLDKYTVGLMILTNDGDLAHRLLSPKHHAEKVYYFTCEKELDHIEELERGVHIEGGYLTKPCKVKKISDRSGEITLTEGKYHQIKQMLHAVGNKIVTLKRIEFAGIPLDKNLSQGQYRELTKEEVEMLQNNK